MNIFEKFFKKKENEETAYIIKVSDQDYIIKILSEQKLQYEDVDWDSVQSLIDFSNFANPKINYSPNDFLVQLHIDVLNELKENRKIDFYQVDSFGWYYKKVHRNEIKLFNSTHPNKLNNLNEQNPKIHATSFDQFRDTYRPLMATNILTGAMGLAYHCFKEDYDEFFRKIIWSDDEWVLNSTKLKTFDRQILIQLLLFQNNDNTELIDSITNGSSTLKLYSKILKDALKYFIYNEYSMKGFLQFMADQNVSPETEPLVKELKRLNERYVAKGLSYYPKISHAKYIKEFIDLAKTDTGQLKHLLEGKELNKTAIFLLGMLNLGDRLDEQFAFDNFVPSIISLTIEHIIEMDLRKDDICIGFNTLEIEKNRNNKFDYVRQYCKELQLIKDLKDQVLELQKTREELRTVLKGKNHGSDEVAESEIPDKEEFDDISDNSDITDQESPNKKPGTSENLFHQ